MNNGIHLKILLPNKVFLETENVQQIVAKSTSRLFAILPNRMDCIAILEPSLLFYDTDANQRFIIAIDFGVLIKTKADVFISVRNAFTNTSASAWREKMANTFAQSQRREQDQDSELMRVEAKFYRLLSEVTHAQK
jgi:F-type H+-transporting ATPase subunit epsilon